MLSAALLLCVAIILWILFNPYLGYVDKLSSWLDERRSRSRRDRSKSTHFTPPEVAIDDADIPTPKVFEHSLRSSLCDWGLMSSTIEKQVTKNAFDRPKAAA